MNQVLKFNTEKTLRAVTGIELLDVESGEGEWMITREERQPVYSRDGTAMLVTKHGQIWTLAGSIREEAEAILEGVKELESNGGNPIASQQAENEEEV